MNSFGRIFSLSIYGESHGKAIGIVVDGCPPGIPLKEEDFATDLDRRKSGAKGTTPRTEEDKPFIMSGVFNGMTTGAPIHVMFQNTNMRSQDYDQLKDTPRPGHADYVAQLKYKGFNDHRGGGHFSGRLTLSLVAAGVVAKKIIPKISIKARLIEAGGQTNISAAVDKALESGDSVGGIVECRVNHVPAVLGEPFFDSLESQLSHICFSIPAIKGIEFGSGFKAAAMKGSEHNDTIFADGTTKTNHAGGINGGISNGNELVFRVAVKPTSSISMRQQTANLSSGEMLDLEIKGRHDACIALRVPVVLEAVTAVVLADNVLLANSKY
ncbi:MAG: chorismate synthase [Bacteroidota bacterium]|nr:chorismate synthase [Bacteroidota bacterium]